MNCERCGGEPAGIQYTEYQDGEVHKLRICEDCARSLGFHVTESDVSPSGTVPVPAKLLSVHVAVSKTPELEDQALAGVRCPGCGLTIEELRKLSLFGCAQCYSTFGEALAPLFKRIHGEARHFGRIPGGERIAPVPVETLREDLRRALAEQDLESAAKLRDELRRAGSPEDEPPEASPPGEDG